MKLNRVLRQRVIEATYPKLGYRELTSEGWRLKGARLGVTHKGHPTLLVEFTHPGGVAGIERAHAFAALDPHTMHVMGVRHLYHRHNWADMTIGWFEVKPRDRGVGSLLVAHGLETAKDWGKRVHVLSVAANNRWPSHLMRKMGLENERGKLSIPKDRLAQRPWKDYLLRKAQSNSTKP